MMKDIFHDIEPSNRAACKSTTSGIIEASTGGIPCSGHACSFEMSSSRFAPSTDLDVSFYSPFMTTTCCDALQMPPHTAHYGGVNYCPMVFRHTCFRLTIENELELMHVKDAILAHFQEMSRPQNMPSTSAVETLIM
jgi:hypothetical protein